MRQLIGALLAAAALAFTLPAAAQQPSTFGHEISLFGMWEDQREPADVETTDVFVRYGRFFRPQVVGTIGLTRSRVETATTDVASTALLIGAKYYFSQPRAQAIVPFLDAAIGVAHTDTGPRDSTDLAWEFGGGVSWFFTGATSFDAGLRFFQTDTDVETKGTRLFVGITTRF